MTYQPVSGTVIRVLFVTVSCQFPGSRTSDSKTSLFAPGERESEEPVTIAPSTSSIPETVDVQSMIVAVGVDVGRERI